MSGHSKWSTIKRAKGVTDAKRSQQFSKLSKAITVAAKHGGVDPNGNPRLRLAIEAARAASMPKDNINRAIEKSVSTSGPGIEETTYEGYGPGGSALLIEALTDNRNRTVAELRSIFNKHGGSMSEAGSVSWMFKPQAVVQVTLGASDPDEVSMIAIEAGAADLEVDSETGTLTVLTEPTSLTEMTQILSRFGEVEADFQMVASNTVALDADTEYKLLQLIEALEDNEDVNSVSSNATLQTA